MPVKSPIRKMTSWPSSWNWRSLLISTVWPRCRSGAVGSKPALIRSGVATPKLADEILLGEQILYSPFEFSELRVGEFPLVSSPGSNASSQARPSVEK